MEDEGIFTDGGDVGSAFDITMNKDLDQEKIISEAHARHARRLRTVRTISIVCIFLTIIQGGASMGVGLAWRAISVTAIGADMFVDLLGSALVMWRFWNAPKVHPRYLDATTKKKKKKKKKKKSTLR
eukprot:Trichotokara_eunicae@DN10882_c0_g1_i3.p1